MLSFLFHSQSISTVATDQYSLLEKNKNKNQPNKQKKKRYHAEHMFNCLGLGFW